MLDKIILNLLGNAIKFTPSGGSIDVELRDHGADFEITVVDTGEGIPADQLPLLFQRFGQVDRAARRRSYGTGLGLALVKEFAELMGGRVVVDSQLGLGARFQVRLPRTEVVPAGSPRQGSGHGGSSECRCEEHAIAPSPGGDDDRSTRGLSWPASLPETRLLCD
jgi:K+-sensing histidine kinase KdpD